MIFERRPDWMITNDPRFYWPLILTGRTTGTRTALFRHWEYMSRGRASRTLLPRLANRFILVSQAQRESFRRDGVAVDGMQILYNPFDTARLEPSAGARERVRNTLGVQDATVVIGYVGRMIKDKGIFELLAAADTLLSAEPTARILWVGDGPDLKELRAKAEDSPYKAAHLFHGRSDDMQGIYNAIDVLVVPSLYPDPCPRVPLEAQACGTAVVCNDAGGLRETLLPNVSGMLVPRGDVGQLAAAILMLTRDRQLRGVMGQAGRQFVCANFSFDSIARNFEQVLADRRYIHRVPGTVEAT
jgi:glycosyltransferase involved in cell wall biosynthesis